MKARAPGKIVISGAYVVLEGAPALATAVDRYALADTERSPEQLGREVLAALSEGDVPFADSSALYHGKRKLGLGSSAAVLVASLAAVLGSHAPRLDRQQLLDAAMRAHRAAQGGGSGIDIATAVWGGTICFTHSEAGPKVARVRLPSRLCIEVWSSGTAASTPRMLEAVRAYAASSPSGYAALMGQLRASAERAVRAVERDDASDFIRALGEQCENLSVLGDRARVVIVDPALLQLERQLETQGACLLPAGAGGGDVAVWAGVVASPPHVREELQRIGYELLPVSVAAPGVELLA